MEVHADDSKFLLQLFKTLLTPTSTPAMGVLKTLTMKGTDKFKQTIEKYLQGLAEEDFLFRDAYTNPKKNIDECCNYIFSQVQKAECNGFADAEIYGMAVHYYTEEDLQVVEEAKDLRVVVNHHVEISEEEKAEAKQRALDEVVAEQRRLLAKKPAPAKPKTTEPIQSQQSLF